MRELDSLPDLSLVDWQNPISDHAINQRLAFWCLAGSPGVRSRRWFDLRGRNHATLTNMDPATDWQPTQRRGGWGQLDLVSASSQSIIVPSAIITGYPFTMSIWVRPDALSGVMFSTLRDDAALWTGHYLDISSSRAQAVSVVSNTFRVSASAGVMSTGQWQQVTGVFRSATSRQVFVNGAPGTLNTDSSSPSGMNNTVVSGSKRSTHDSFFDGRVDNVRIWRRALAAAEVRELHRLDQQYQSGLLNRRSIPLYSLTSISDGGSLTPPSGRARLMKGVG